MMNVTNTTPTGSDDDELFRFYVEEVKDHLHHSSTERRAPSDRKAASQQRSGTATGRKRGASQPEQARGDREARPHTYKYNRSVVFHEVESPKSERFAGISTENTASKKLVRPPTGYIQEWETVPFPAWDYVQSRLDELGLNADDQRLFKHILNSGSSWANDSLEIGWVPVGWRLIDRVIPEANPRRLIDTGLIESDSIYIPNVKSYRYRVCPNIREEYTRLTYESLKHGNPVWVNLFGSNGRTVTRRDKSKLNDKNRNPHPKLIREAMQIVKVGYYNRRAAFEHVDRLQVEAFRAKAERGATAEEYLHTFGRYSNDLTALRTLERQKIQHEYDDVWSYRIAYEPTSTGRITHVGTGAQSCTREMKAAIYKDVRDVHNYDIRSSQVVILRDELNRAGFDTEWLDNYLSTEGAKYVYAERAGVTVDTWKRILMAVVMGSALRWHTQQGYQNAVREYIEAEAGERAQEVFEQVKGVLAPLYAVVREWHSIYLTGFWLMANSYRAKDGKRYLKNDTGSVFCIDDVENENELRRKLAAFILQGREAAFIYSLTILSNTGHYGFEVIANEHDGLVTLGEIPQEAIDVVRQARSMQFVEIVEKSFVYGLDETVSPQTTRYA